MPGSQKVASDHHHHHLGAHWKCEFLVPSRPLDQESLDQPPGLSQASRSFCCPLARGSLAWNLAGPMASPSICYPKASQVRPLHKSSGSTWLRAPGWGQSSKLSHWSRLSKLPDGGPPSLHVSSHNPTSPRTERGTPPGPTTRFLPTPGPAALTGCPLWHLKCATCPRTPEPLPTMLSLPGMPHHHLSINAFPTRLPCLQQSHKPARGSSGPPIAQSLLSRTVPLHPWEAFPVLPRHCYVPSYMPTASLLALTYAKLTTSFPSVSPVDWGFLRGRTLVHC